MPAKSHTLGSIDIEHLSKWVKRFDNVKEAAGDIEIPSSTLYYILNRAQVTDRHKDKIFGIIEKEKKRK